MSDDKISRVIRQRPSDRRADDDPLRQARWDKRLEAARARRAQVLSEKRARGEAPGQTLISRRPWEDEGAGPLGPAADVPSDAAPQPSVQDPVQVPTQVQGQPPAPPAQPASRVLRLVPRSPEALPDSDAPDAPDRPASSFESAVAAASGTPQTQPPLPLEFPVERAPDPETQTLARRRRVGPLALVGGFAIGGLVALGVLFMGGEAGLGPDAAQPSGGADAPVTAPTAATPAPAPLAEAAEPVMTPPPAPPVSAPPASPAAQPTEAASLQDEATPQPEVVLDPPRAIDLAALNAIALGAPPAAEPSVAGALAGLVDARAPRSFAPPPLLPPDDPVLAGLGVRAQVSAPSARPGPQVPDGAEVVGLARPSAAAPQATPTGSAALVPPLAEAIPARLPDPAGGVVAALVPAAFAGLPEGDAAPELAPLTLALPAPRPLALSPVAAPIAEAAPALSVDAPAPLPTAAPALVDEARPEETQPEAVASSAAPDGPADTPAAAPAAVPPPRADAVLVHILVPRDAAPGGADAVLERIGATGYLSRDPAQVGVTIRQTQVRFYHPEDAAAAALIADAVGGPARDFTGFRPQPPEGTVEVWLKGEPAPAPEPVRAPVAVRAAPAPAPAPAPPPPPQPVGYCWRGEPGTPGAIRVPIVDGRCAWP
ncbi:hypothetical protein ACRDNQ_15045 [Palleronia sp. KMU-117]|uniref:hypothetical protein n=1 Tax=Palleronia sp. KMU-117 TaxID=3434108 RepID=UPI003D7098FD